MASTIAYAKFKYLLGDGTPGAGYSVYIYEANTSTKKNSYSDSSLTIPNTNPVILDATGSAYIFVSGSYKVVVANTDGVIVDSSNGLWGLGSTSINIVENTGINWISQEADYQAINLDRIMAKDGCSVVSLPPVPIKGEVVEILRVNASSVSVDPGSELIQGASGSMAITNRFSRVSFVYSDDAALGWVVTVGGAGTGGGSGSVTTYTVDALDHTVANGDRYVSQTDSGARTFTFPSSPDVGTNVIIKRQGSNLVNTVMSGNNVMGTLFNPTIPNDNGVLDMIYVGGTTGWVITVN